MILYSVDDFAAINRALAAIEGGAAPRWGIWYSDLSGREACWLAIISPVKWCLAGSPWLFEPSVFDSFEEASAVLASRTSVLHEGQEMVVREYRE